jgi:hypothetical protein
VADVAGSIALARVLEAGRLHNQMGSCRS